MLDEIENKLPPDHPLRIEVYEHLRTSRNGLSGGAATAFDFLVTLYVLRQKVYDLIHGTCNSMYHVAEARRAAAGKMRKWLDENDYVLSERGLQDADRYMSTVDISS